MTSWITEYFRKIVDGMVAVVEHNATVEEAIECLAVYDQLRKRLDRIQADPKRRPNMALTQSDLEDRPEREGREGDTQPMPKGNDLPVMHHLVQRDLEDRLQVGIKRYGQPLQPHNGRNALRDAYEEACDLCVYLRQALFERDGF